MLPGPNARSTNGYCSNSSSFIDSDQQPPTTITLLGMRSLAARACIRWATKRSSAFSRIVQVLKTTTSASSGVAASPRPERLEQALDPLGVVHVHLAAERRDVVALHARQFMRPVGSGTSSIRRCANRARCVTPSSRSSGSTARDPTDGVRQVGVRAQADRRVVPREDLDEQSHEIRPALESDR